MTKTAYDVADRVVTTGVCIGGSIPMTKETGVGFIALTILEKYRSRRLSSIHI